MFGQFHGQSPLGLTRVIAADCRVLPQHPHSESHLALISDSKCESEAAIAIPQLIINQRPETDDHWELPQSAKRGHWCSENGCLRAAIREPCTLGRFALQCIAIAMQVEHSMADVKSRTIPSLRVSEQLRNDVENVLAPGESLSAFVMDAVSRSIDFRKTQLDFLARGMASAERARALGGYVPAEKAVTRLRKRLASAQRTRP